MTVRISETRGTEAILAAEAVRFADAERVRSPLACCRENFPASVPPACRGSAAALTLLLLRAETVKDLTLRITARRSNVESDLLEEAGFLKARHCCGEELVDAYPFFVKAFLASCTLPVHLIDF